MKRGKIFVVSGPSGVGKGSIVNEVSKIPELNFYWAKSYTTRAMRSSDKEEGHYIFVEKKKFKELEKMGEILESNYFNGNWYGSSRKEVEFALNEGRNVLKEIEVNGALKLKKLYPESVLIFINADLKEVENRLRKRGQNSEEEISERLTIARGELRFKKEYDYTVTNHEDRIEEAIGEAKTIISKELDKR